MLSFQGSEGRWIRKNYMKLADKEKGGKKNLASGEKLSSCFLLVRMCEFFWNFIIISWGQKSLQASSFLESNA